jgi:hypothetical protein
VSLGEEYNQGCQDRAIRFGYGSMFSSGSWCCSGSSS